MEDREFLDYMYQGWTKTTGAEDKFWMPSERKVIDASTDGEEPPCFDIVAVDKDQNEHLVALAASEEDAAFITAIHGCFGDLVRRMHHALDDAERFEIAADNHEAEFAELCIQNEELKQQLQQERQGYVG